MTVNTHDLARLLLAFREQVEHGGGYGHPWVHMADWDISFEALADAVEEADARLDNRMRCNSDERVYEWPSMSRLALVNVRSGSAIGHTQPKLRHLAGRREGSSFSHEALCEFSFTDQDVTKRPKVDYPICRVCEREARLRGIDMFA